jgi:hypothetical protein
VLDGPSRSYVHDLDRLALRDFAGWSGSSPAKPRSSPVAILDQVLDGDGECVVTTSRQLDDAYEPGSTADLLTVEALVVDVAVINERRHVINTTGVERRNHCREHLTR